MARSDTRYSVYPTPRAIDVVGNSAPALNQAIECWAALLARATAKNSRTFHQGTDPLKVMDSEANEVAWRAMHEWSLLAVTLKDLRFDPEFANPGRLLATAVEDAHKLEYIGAKCYQWGIFIENTIDTDIEIVVKKLCNLDYVHAWAVIVAVQWFWEHHDEGIDINKDPWWTLGFRCQWKERHASKQGSDGTEGQQPETEGRKRKRRTESKGKAGTEGR